MKKLFTTTTILLLLFGASYSQVYQKMLDRSSWTVNVSSMGGIYTRSVIYISDTIIDNKNYVVYYDSIPMGTSNIKILREDTLTRKVFTRNGGQDKLLFDFSLDLSDMIILDGSEYYVHEISNIDVIGGKRKQIWLRRGFANVFWIEGVGNTYHPLLQYTLGSNPHLDLLCSFQNNVNIYNMGLARGQDSSECRPAVNVSVKKLLPENSFKIYPNPVTNTLHIEYTSTTPDKVEILDIHGRTLYSYNVYPTQTSLNISLDSFAGGVYFVKLFNDNGVVLEKVMKQ